MIRRHFHSLLTLAMLGALPLVGLAESPGWTPSFDVDLGTITDIDAAAGVAYAATYNGVFRSDDGRSWTAAGLQGRSIYSVVVDTAGETVYAVEYPGRLWVSVDRGVQWRASAPELWVNFVTADPREPNRVWIGVYPGTDLWSTEDQGEHWERIATGIIDSGIWRLLIDAHDGTMYAWGFERFHSKPAGSPWQRAGAPRDGGLSSVIVGSSAPGLLYAVAQRGFCRSPDHASTWSCETESPAYQGQLAEIPADGTNPPRLLWSGAGRLMTSDDGGQTWTRVAGGSVDSSVIQTVAVEANGRVFAGGYDFALRSDDRGASWQPVASGLRAAWIESLASGPDSLWASSGGPGSSLFTRAADGESWSVETLPGESPVLIGEIAVDAATSAVYAGGEHTLFRKAPGKAWKRSNLTSFLYSIATDPTSPESAWIGTESGVAHTTDGGSTWSYSSEAIAQAVFALVVDPERPNRIYAGSYAEYECPFGCYPYGGSIFRSDDSGATWKQSPDVHSTVGALVFDPFDGDGLYAGTWQGGVVRSADGGETWRFPSSPPPGDLTALVPDPARRGTLYASTTSGVFRSRDRGRSWLSFGSPLPHGNARSLAISPDGRVLHVATVGAGVLELVIEDEPLAAFPCVPGPSRLCLLDKRFQVELAAKDKNSGEPEAGVAHALGDRAGYFAVESFTGETTLPEVAVKMLPDGAFGIEGFPFLYSSMTSAGFSLVVTDTIAGVQSAYHGYAARPFCGGADLAPSDALEAQVGTRQSAAPGAQTLSLLGGRFAVSLEARTRSGRVAAGVPISSGDRFGFFSLPGITGDATLPELAVKMLDGRGFNDAFWVFHSSLTGLDYTLTVRDEQTGATRTYESGEPFCGGADITAFPE